MWIPLYRKLKTNGSSWTPAREKLFNSIKRSGPITFKGLADLNPQIHHVTIYRTLDLFRELKIIQDVVVGGQKMIELASDFKPNHVHHISCIACGKAYSFRYESLENQIQRAAKKFKFTELSHVIELRGRCPRCQK